MVKCHSIFWNVKLDILKNSIKNGLGSSRLKKRKNAQGKFEYLLTILKCFASIFLLWASRKSLKSFKYRFHNLCYVFLRKSNVVQKGYLKEFCTYYIYVPLLFERYICTWLISCKSIFNSWKLNLSVHIHVYAHHTTFLYGCDLLYAASNLNLSKLFAENKCKWYRLTSLQNFATWKKSLPRPKDP